MYKHLFNFNKIYPELAISEITPHESGKFGYPGTLTHMNSQTWMYKWFHGIYFLLCLGAHPQIMGNVLKGGIFYTTSF